MNSMHHRSSVPGFLGLMALAMMWAAAPAAQAASSAPWRMAQDQPPGTVPGDGGDEASDSSALLVKVGRLEGQIRTLTGQIEQLQFQNKRLEDNLRKMQQDVDFRFQDLQGHGAPAAAPARPVATAPKRGEAETPDADGSVATADAAPVQAPAAPAALPRVPRQAAGDAFDPDADPSAPGAPHALGTTPPSQALASRTSQTGSTDTRAPLDLMKRPGTVADAGATANPDDVSIIAAPPVARAVPNPAAVASLVPGGTREEFDSDVGLYKQGQYDSAATGLQSFLQKYPKDKLIPDAVFLLGESYSRLGRHREAAEQFLKMSTDYGKSARAPDALLRLGMSLNAMGAKEQACATYQEVNRRYPAASADVRAGVDRELKRSRCQG